MRAGKLRHSITIKTYSTSQDSYGQESKSYSTLATRRASIEPLSGKESTVAEQYQSEVTHEIRLRYLDNVVPQAQVIFGSRTFEVLQVINPEERNRELVLLAKERV